MYFRFMSKVFYIKISKMSSFFIYLTVYDHKNLINK